jgi:raffinose/stachyose/melibiose transport system permease protein
VSAIRVRLGMDSVSRGQSRTDVLRDKLRGGIRKYLTVGLLVLPGMLVFVLFVLVPVVRAAQYSLYDWKGFGPLTNYVGLHNYDRLYHQRIFRSAVSHSFLIATLSVTIQLPIALILALMVGRGTLRGRSIFRAFLFVPYVFSEVITAIIWSYVLHPSPEGLANLVFAKIIPGFKPQTWLAAPGQNIVMYSVFAVLTWKFFGFHMIIYMAGLQGVSQELEDAARVDGASEPRVLRHVTLPLLAPTIQLTVFLSVLGSFQQFAVVWILTREGSPANSNHIISTYLYKFGIKTFYLGYGSAIAITLFLMTLLFSLGYQYFIVRQNRGR